MQKFSESIGTQINIAARAMKNQLEKELAAFGISPSQWMVLMALGEKDHQVQTDLAKMVNLDNATVTRIIDKLAEMGLLERAQDKDDRRAQIVSITAKGRTAHRKWNAAGKLVNERAASGLKKQEIACLMNCLLVIQENLEVSNSSNNSNRNHN